MTKKYGKEFRLIIQGKPLKDERWRFRKGFVMVFLRSKDSFPGFKRLIFGVASRPLKSGIRTSSIYQRGEGWKKHV